MSNAFNVEKLCKNYPGFCLKDVSFSLPEGYVMGFIGPNGAGKTTTIKAILGITGADGGSVSVLETASVLAMEQVGVVMDSPFYPDDWAAADVERALRPFYSRWDSGLFASYLGRFGIDRRKKIKDLSRGMKVKLMLAVALCHEAKLLLLDEPTSGLDPVARDQLLDILREYIGDGSRSILFSTHITSDLEKIADYITFILGGNIIFSGTRDELVEKYRIVRGGPNDLTPEVRKQIIGLRAYPSGFEGMAETAKLNNLPLQIIAENANLEEIMIYINREAEVNEQHA